MQAIRFWPKMVCRDRQISGVKVEVVEVGKRVTAG